MKTSAAVTAAAALLCLSGLSARAQEKISDGVVKVGLIEDMSSIYADITGIGAVTAAKMATEDFGGKVLGKPIEVVSADHQNKADIASSTAREWFDSGHVDALMDVAASATALAAIDVAKAKNKIVMLSGPGSARITMRPVRRSRCITPTTTTRCRTARVRRLSGPVTIAGSLSPPTTRLATISNRTPPLS